MPLKPALNIRPKSILFATDLSQASRRPMRHALALARHYGATLHFAHIISSLGFALAGPDAIAVAREVACRDLHELEAGLSESGALAGIKYDSVVREGEVWPQIERLIDEDDVDMIVIGSHGRRGIGRFLLGSVAEEIFRRVSCPVLTVGPCATGEFGVENTRNPQPIILATDFKDASLQALPYAVTFARERNVKLVLLHVISLLPMPPHGEWDSADDLIARREKAKAEAITRLQALLRDCSPPPSNVEYVVQCGEPAEEILKTADAYHADAIAMGLHRTGYVETVSHLRRTIAYEVVCRANCAVFTVRD
jgi:nucleotide-binding universal stress UspA family protein